MCSSHPRAHPINTRDPSQAELITHFRGAVLSSLTAARLGSGALACRVHSDLGIERKGELVTGRSVHLEVAQLVRDGEASARAREDLVAEGDGAVGTEPEHPGDGTPQRSRPDEHAHLPG